LPIWPASEASLRYIALLVRIALIWVLVPAAVILRSSLISSVGFSRIRIVPVIVELEAPLVLTVSVSVAEVICCAWVAAASTACRGGRNVLAGLPPADVPPEEQAARRISVAADKPMAARCRTGQHWPDRAADSFLRKVHLQAGACVLGQHGRGGSLAAVSGNSPNLYGAS
jgi:hypothetical protein